MKRSRHLARLLVALTASAALSACASRSRHYAGAPAPAAMHLAQAPADGVAEAEAPGGSSPEAAQPAPASVGRPPAARPPGANNRAPGEQVPATQAGEAQAQSAPMLIYTADFLVRVERERFDDVLDGVLAGARERGGYLVRRNDTSIQVRVPSARFHESVTAVEGLGEVMRRNVAAEDVSEEFRDAEVRLTNLRAVRARLEEFLRRAGTMAEALQVERELERVTQEIDRIQGRMRFLSTRAAFSLITVSLQPRPTVIAAPRTEAPPRRVLELPMRWLRELGLDHLLRFERED